MATAKKTGIVAKVKDAITGMFSNDSKRKSQAETATKNGKTKAAKGPKKTATKVAAPVRNAGKSARKAAAKKAPARKPAERKVGAL
jgi:hypothetical protein